MFFPEMFSSVETTQYYAQLKKRTELILKEILGDKKTKEIEQIDEYLFSLGKPKMFTGRKGVEVKYIKDFEQLCIIMSQHINTPPKTMKTLEFYQAWAIIKKQIEKK